MAESFLLDTSALVALLADEPGASAVAGIVSAAAAGKARVFLSFATLTELYYLVWREQGEGAAKEVMVATRSLPVRVINTTERLALLAGRLKAMHRLSFADAVIAATALECGAVLVHKDPELKALHGTVRQQLLPLKGRRGSNGSAGV